MEKSEHVHKLFTAEELESLERQELVKIIIEQQNKLKERENESHGKEDDSTAPKRRKTKQDRPFDWSKYSKRHVAMKIAYLGWDYLGLVVQKNASPTVEEKLHEALKRTKLIEDVPSANYSRCGRTDKGVSAFGQVISLTVRSNCSTGLGIVSQGSSKQDGPEIDYVTMLNHHLPDDIRVLSWCPVAPEFDARFACKWRLYRYYFVRNNLDINAMQTAGAHLVGEHDFRNFCKMDAHNVHNYTRTLLSFEIEPQDDGRSLEDPQKMFAFVIKGYAFLWHQVRCLEIISDMLDLSKFPKKPVYTIASEIPLVLYDSGYADGVIHWENTPETHQGVWKHFQRSWEERAIRGTVVKSMLHSLTVDTYVIRSNDLGTNQPLVPWTDVADSTPDKNALREKYTVVAKRDTETSYDEKVEGVIARLERTGKTKELERLRAILAEKAAGKVPALTDFDDFCE